VDPAIGYQVEAFEESKVAAMDERLVKPDCGSVRTEALEQEAVLAPVPCGILRGDDARYTWKFREQFEQQKNKTICQSKAQLRETSGDC